MVAISATRRANPGDELSPFESVRFAAGMLPNPTGGSTLSSKTGIRTPLRLPVSASSRTHSDVTELSVQTTSTDRQARISEPITWRQVFPAGMVLSQKTDHPVFSSALT